MTFEEKQAQAEAIWASGPRKFVAGIQGFVKADRGSVDHPHQKAKGRPPTSVSLPRTSEVGEAATLNGHRVRRLKCGAYATMRGKRIVDSQSSGDRHAADCGYTRITDE